MRFAFAIAVLAGLVLAPMALAAPASRETSQKDDDAKGKGKRSDDKGADKDNDAGAEKGKDAGAEKGKDAGADKGKDAGADKGKDAGADKGKDAGAGKGKDTGGDKGKGSGSESSANASVSASVKKSGQRSGTVVRVERPRVTGSGRMRGCLGLSMDVREFTCFGAAAPEVGDQLLVLDDTGVIGRAEVSAVAASPHDQCGAHVAHDIKVNYERPPRQRSPTSGPSTLAALGGLDDDGAAPRLLTDPSSVKSPSGRSEQVWLAVDRDGDGQADAAATAREGCEEATSSLPPPRVGQRYHGMCLDYYTQAGGEWTHVSSDTYVICF